MTADKRATVALEEGRRALDRQHSDVENLRDRSATLFGAGAVAASLFGLATTEHASLDGWTIAGLAAFTALTATVAFVLWPHPFEFVQSPAIMLAWVDAEDPDASFMERELALRMDEQWDRNEVRLKLLTRAYSGATLILLLEIGLLFVGLRD